MVGRGSRPRSGDVVAALDRLPIPAFTIARDGTFTWANRAAHTLFGDVVGRNLTAIVAPESERAVREQFARKIVGDAESTEYEAVLVRPEGERLVAEISSVRLERDGAVVGVFGELVPERVLPPLRTTELTPRQAEVLRHLAVGASTAEIARGLGLSNETVRNHVRDLLKRLDVHRASRRCSSRTSEA